MDEMNSGEPSSGTGCTGRDPGTSVPGTSWGVLLRELEAAQDVTANELPSIADGILRLGTGDQLR